MKTNADESSMMYVFVYCKIRCNISIYIYISGIHDLNRFC